MAGAGGATAVVQQPAAGAPPASGARSGGAGSGAAPAVADPRAEALRCPRCDSANTKFCYYNNYSLSQPRHFCKACKRYWTRGGTLRNVPVGGGCRKNKRSRSGASGSTAGRTGGSSSATAAVTSSSAASTLSLPPPPSGSSLPSLSSALGLSGSTSLASLLLGTTGAGAGDLGLFQAAMQSVVSSEAATAYEMQQQHHQTQVDHLLGLGYGSTGGQIHQLKPWMQEVAGGGIMDTFYAPLLSSCSLVPGLEELHVKAEAAGAGDHHHHNKAAATGGEQHQSGGGSWELPTPSSSNVDANIIASDALMAAAASMNPGVSSTSTAATTTAPSSFMYWGNGGIGGAATAWPDLANCGSSIATLF
ncbi:hypothetical protein HU200_051336 [Digitaria exilis]|uniref:Dof zinc finger protein n=1 Tax=Digitaria exilis TaxID=1010633 RepID=A0A835AQH8_9POAL|nr:hypothetical protein HU200_051336 [Digitaria exilis]CAB3454414.1 unnamed protein product [Digitaria exilis]